MSHSLVFDIVKVFEDDVDAWTRPFVATYQGCEYDLYLSYEPQFGYCWYTYAEDLPEELRADLDTMDLGDLDDVLRRRRSVYGAHPQGKVAVDTSA